jgi:hypothetical protein
MNIHKRLLIPILLHFSVLFLFGQRGAQDTWYLDKELALPEMPGLNSPFGLAFSSNGDSYVVDHGNDSVTVWDSNGNFKTRWGTNGANEGQLYNPRDIAIAGNEVYIVDQSNNRVQVFDLNGTYLRKWGTAGSGDGQFLSPQAITLDLNGSTVSKVWVADYGNHRVQAFDSNGTFLSKIGTYGSADSQLYNATGVAIGPDDLLYISSLYHNKVKVFETNGTYVRSISAVGRVYHLDFSGDQFAVCASDNHRVQIFDKNSSLVTTIGTSASAAPGLFTYNRGLQFDPQGDLHVTCQNNHRVQVFDVNGSYKRTYGFLGSKNMSPYDICRTPQNTFLVTETSGHRVFEMDINGTYLRSIASNGNGDGLVTNPRSVHLGPDNRIYVADTSYNRVQVFDRNGSFIYKFGSAGNGDGQFNQPYGIVVTENNETFVVDRYNHRIQVFDSNGTFLRKFGSSGNLEGQMSNPIDITLSDEGNILVLDYSNRRIIHFTQTGQFIKHKTTSTNMEFIGNLNNGLIGTSRGSTLYLYDDDGLMLKSWTKTGSSSSAFECLPDGTIVWLNYNYNKLLFYKPTYRTVRPPVSKEVPQTEVLSVKQVANTNHLEISFRINDADSSHVNAKMLGFIDGGNDLSKVIVPKTFVGSIAGKLDANVSTNQDHNVTWNVGADWSVGYGELEIAILAKDDRDLLNLHFLTLPATDSNSTELQISRSPLNNTDLLNVWYWLIASGDTSVVHNPSMSSVNLPVQEVNSSSFAPTSISSLVLWLDANDSTTLTQSNDVVTQWNDKSGNNHHAQTGNGTPTLKTSGGPNGNPYIEFRADYLNISGSSFFAKHIFHVFKSPNAQWNSYGGVFGHQSGRYSNYLFQGNSKYFHSNRYPSLVTKNGMDLSSSNGFNMDPLTNFMILEIVVDNSSESNKTNYKVGRVDNYSMDFDLVEILAFDQQLTSERADVINYLSKKSGIATVGLSLASTSTTTDLGRAHLFNLMNLREATTEERNRAREGAISGAVNTFTPTFKVGPNERPSRVNEYGFDTGTTSGYWVTPK